MIVMVTNPNQVRRSRSSVGPVLLIVIGIGALLSNLGGDVFGGGFVPFAVGVAFLVAYAATRKYGFLVPGGILTGIGAAILAATQLSATDTGAYAAIGGGIGFLLIYALDVVVSGTAARWWPVIPGGLMVVAGASMAGGNQELIRQLGLWSPVVLIVLGLVSLVARFRQPSA
ncbi:MAG TPA: hypothetical protein VIJ30_05430 [Candidatus Dormibacteraeota bacterium]